MESGSVGGALWFSVRLRPSTAYPHNIPRSTVRAYRHFARLLYGRAPGRDVSDKEGISAVTMRNPFQRRPTLS